MAATAAAAAALLKASEDRLSETSESTASGSGSPPSEPPMSPDLTKLSRALRKPQELMLSTSTRASSTSTMSPVGLTFETESVSSPHSRGSFASLDAEMRAYSASAFHSIDLAGAELAEQAADLSTPKAPPPAPKYSAPSVAAPSLPPPPVLPPGVPEPPSAPPRLPAAASAPPPLSCPKTVPPSTLPSLGPAAAAPASTPAAPKSPAFGYNPPASLPNGAAAPAPPLPSTVYGASLPDASQRAQLSRLGVPTLSEAPPPTQPPVVSQLLSQAESGAQLTSSALFSPTGAAAIPPLPGSAPPGSAEDIEGEVNQALALLSLLWTGPTVPPLPPSGCYGGVFVSSAISEGLGTEAAATAEAAARELGERPVKVLLPWYPAHPGIAAFDQTKPAKVSPSPAEDWANGVPPVPAH